MKKKLLLVIALFILCGIALCLVFSWNSTDAVNEQIVTLSKIALQAIISGFVTFLGLYFTISFNEYLLKYKEIIKIRPVLYIKPKEKASAKIERKKITNENALLCSNSNSVRTVRCELGNSNNCGVNNIYIKKFPRINNEIIHSNSNNQYVFVLKDNSYFSNKFKIVYEDIMGNKYKQKIKYKYLKEKTTYKFISCNPKRRLL